VRISHEGCGGGDARTEQAQQRDHVPEEEGGEEARVGGVALAVPGLHQVGQELQHLELGEVAAPPQPLVPPLRTGNVCQVQSDTLPARGMANLLVLAQQDGEQVVGVHQHVLRAGARVRCAACSLIAQGRTTRLFSAAEK
jgi:hypothetical protein